MMITLPPSLAGLPVYFISPRQKTPWEPDDPRMLYGVKTLADLNRALKRQNSGLPMRNSREAMFARLRRIVK